MTDWNAWAGQVLTRRMRNSEIFVPGISLFRRPICKKTVKMCKSPVVNVGKRGYTENIQLCRKAGEEMERNVIKALLKWKASEERKPMVLKGARQVGKTWLMKELGQHFYEHFV